MEGQSLRLRNWLTPTLMRSSMRGNRACVLSLTMISICSSSLFQTSAAFLLSQGPLGFHQCRARATTASAVKSNSDVQENSGGDKKLQEPGEGGSRNRVKVQFKGQTLEGQRGELLRSLVLRNSLTPHNEGSQLINCRGLGTCGTCAVQVEGKVSELRT